MVSSRYQVQNSQSGGVQIVNYSRYLEQRINSSSMSLCLHLLYTVSCHAYLNPVYPTDRVNIRRARGMDGLMDQIFSEDPYLAFQPAFAYTLPIQLLVSGITLTLLCVLAIHLICMFVPLLQSIKFPLSYPSMSPKRRHRCSELTLT